MKLLFPENKIIYWAGKYVDFLKGKDKDEYKLEIELCEFRDSAQHRGFLSKEELKQIAKWKSRRSARHIDKNSHGYVETITGWSLSADEERSKIEVLTLLDGVGWPTASAILHFCHVDGYPILDFRALWSLKTEEPKSYKYLFWYNYVKFCRKLAEENDVSMRDLDRALWQHSKENQENK